MEEEQRRNSSSMPKSGPSCFLIPTIKTSKRKKKERKRAFEREGELSVCLMAHRHRAKMGALLRILFLSFPLFFLEEEEKRGRRLISR